MADDNDKPLQRAIATLPAEYRDIFERAVLGSGSYQDIAAELHLSIPAVKTRLHRARIRIQQFLESER